MHVSGEATGLGHCRFAVLRSFSSQPLPPSLCFGRSTPQIIVAAFDPSSHVLMCDGRASGAGRRAAICILLARWTTRSFIPNSERATITRSACMGGRKATHFQSTTTTDSQSVRHSSSSALYRIFSARLSRSLALSVRPSGRPSVRLSVNREVTARPLPSHTYSSSLLWPRPGGSACRHTHVSQGEKPFAKLRQINEALEECKSASRKHVPFLERLEKNGGFTLLLND